MPSPNRSCACLLLSLIILFFTVEPVLGWDSLIGHESCEFALSQMQPEEESATLIIASFITGVNYATGRTQDADIEEMVSWVRDFCVRNPSARFLDALIGLDGELDARTEATATEEAEQADQTGEAGNK